MKTAERPVRLDGLPPASLLKPQNLPLVERLESSDAISQKRKPEEIDAGPSKSKHIIIDDDDVVMLDAPNQSSRIETEIRVAASSKQDDQADTNASEDTVPTPATNTKSLNALRRSLNGVFAVYKPSGMTSYDVVSSIKRSVFGLEEKEKLKGKSKRRYKPPYKIGHGGTLDPLADGVLVIGVGDGTKKMQDYLTGPKIYIGEGLLGAMTDTEDSTGKAIEFQPYAHVTQEALESVLDQFRGTIKQVPPLYSALKVDGRRMYEYAYSGEKLPRDIAARDVTIYTLRLELFTTDHNYQLPPLAEAATSADNTTTVETSANTTESPDAPRPPMFRLYVECGGGTYIRCLIRDIGRAVGSAAHMVKLTRVQQGSFHLEKNVIRLEDCTLDRVKALLTPTETS
jgi:tRNA pseudouridine55 synthase